MMNRYDPNIHHRRSIRLKGYDYSQEGLYFITICCQDRACLFGDVVDGKMILNEYGRIAYDEWIKTPEIRPNVELGEFVVMPNHVHGIIRLHGMGELHSSDETMGEMHLFDGKRGECNSFNERGECNSPLRGPSQTVGAVVRGYKSAVTKKLNELTIGCAVWQRNYYEHIIRNERSYINIAEYIIDNPAKWEEDRFYTK